MLRMVINLNALSCLVFGILFTSWSPSVANYLGSTVVGVREIFWIGIILLGFAIHLISAGLRRKWIRGEIYYFSLGDGLWVIGSGALVLLESNTMTLQGQMATLSVASMVGVFGALQYFLARRLPPDEIRSEESFQGSKENAWQVLADFHGISRYHPLVAESRPFGSIAEGTGASRVCRFGDGSHAEETVTDWEPGEGYSVAISRVGLPLSLLENSIRIEEGKTEIITRFQAKGFFSEILTGFLMRPLLKKRMRRVTRGFAEAFESVATPPA